MKKSCPYCGGIHDHAQKICIFRKSCQKRLTEADRFRNTRTWRAKSLEIRKRDKALCQVCIRELYNTRLRYNFENISVHHIIKLSVDPSKGLDNYNLISLCAYHHTMAEGYDITIQELQDMAAQQEQKNTY